MVNPNRILNPIGVHGILMAESDDPMIKHLQDFLFRCTSNLGTFKFCQNDRFRKKLMGLLLGSLNFEGIPQFHALSTNEPTLNSPVFLSKATTASMLALLLAPAKIPIQSIQS